VQQLSENPIAGFLPWIVFWVVAGSPSTWEFGAIAALLVAVVLLLPTVERGRVKMLDVATVAFFAVMAIVGIIVSPPDRDWLDRWSNVLASGALGALVLASLAFMPFTEQYARESAPPEVWHTPLFRRTNQVLTLVWGGVFVATAILGVISREHPSTSDWTSWVIPIVLIVAAVKFTRAYPEQVRARARAGATAGEAEPHPPRAGAAS
jgi:hypothetical protein